MRRAGVTSLLIAVCLCATAGVARAQVFLGQGGPTGRFVLPPEAGGAAADRSQGKAGADDLVGQGAAPTQVPSRGRAQQPSEGEASATLIRHLPNIMQGYRLGGEIGTSEWPIYLTDLQARQKLRFRVAYLSAVSVMPEASELAVAINDKVVGQSAIRAPSAVATVDFDVPENLLKPGFNAVRVSVRQRHRVDCSLAATYELWTQIDPSQTGFVLNRSDAGVTSLADLAALLPDAQGALPIRAVVSPKTSPSNIERIVLAAQIITLLGRFEQPLVDFGTLAEGDYGVNLVVGTYAELAKIPGLEAIGDVTGPKTIVLPAAPGRRTTIVVTGAVEQHLGAALAQLAVAAEPKGTEAGLRAASVFPGYRVVGGQRVKLHDLGFTSQEFSGRFFRLAFNIIMPPDFYPADYAKVMLGLDGGYGPGLTRDAQVLVKVSGRNAGSVRLPKSTGDVFKQNEIPLPLSLLRPGLNRIEIEALVPAISDASCDPVASIGGGRRFLFLDTTELIVPRIARIARMPDLAVTASGGFPYVASGARPILFVPTPDKETVGAAATIAARMAISAGVALDFKFSILPPPRGSGATLLIAPARALDPVVMQAVGLDPDAVRAVWEQRAEQGGRKPIDDRLSQLEALARNRLVLQRNFPAACSLPKPMGGFVEASKPSLRGALAESPPGGAHGDAAQADQNLLKDWSENVSQKNRWIANVKDAVSNAREWSRTSASGVREWMSSKFENKPAPSPLTSQTSLLMAQNILGSAGDDVWTIVTAPNAALLGESVACLVDPRVWIQVSGRIAALDASEGTVTSAAALGLHFIPTQPLLLGNARLIAAGWLSNNISVFVVLGLLLALILSFATNWLIRNVGRRS